jgi:cytochrome c5
MGRGSLLVLTACATFLACDREKDASTSPPATEQTAAAPFKLNIDEIFPPGEGRDLVLNNCTSCHTIVPIVVLQMTKEAWELNAREHRDRVTSLTDAEITTLYEYLAANFNPNRPVPALPEELLKTWTSY